MKPYIQYFSLSFKKELQYRIAALAGMTTQFFWGFMYLMIFGAFYANGAANTDFKFEQLVDYIWLQQAFLAFIMAWFRDNELFKLITSGNLSYELCRPLDLYHYWYAKLLSKRLASALLRFAPILLVATLLPEPYKLNMPFSVMSFVVFIVALIQGLILMVALSMFVYLMTIKTLSPTGALLVYSIGADFMSGTLIPIPMMPSQWQRFLEWMPFRYTADFSFRVYSGHISVQSALSGLLIQFMWIVFAVLLGKLLMSKSLKSVTLQGG